MLSLSDGKIFLAGARGHSEKDWFRSYNTFNFGSYQQAHKAPFGPLYVLNDDTLAGSRSFIQFVETDTDLILIPTVGALRYTDSTGNETVVEAGQAQLHTLRKGTTFEIANPYVDALINFIQIWIKRVAAIAVPAMPHLVSFNLDHHKNKLLQISPGAPQQRAAAPKLSIGKFTGREEAVYKLTQPRNGVFAFVLQGAFEVQYRLLESRDGLSLSGVPEIELEALSNEAIILLIEVALP